EASPPAARLSHAAHHAVAEAERSEGRDYSAASTRAKRSCATRAHQYGSGCPFCRIENAYRSLTKPVSADASFVVPVFACTFPRRGAARILECSVPLTPATGRALSSTGLS